MIEPIHMAEIYWVRARKEAAHQVLAILSYYKAAANTQRYWKEVLSHLSRKREGKKNL